MLVPFTLFDWEERSQNTTRKPNTLLQIKSKYVNLSLETSKLLTLNLSNLRMAILGISTDEKEETRKYIDGYK